MRASKLFLPVLMASTLASVTLHAQTKPAAPATPAVGSDPAATTASYGDWVVRCVKNEADKGKRLCEVVQTLQVQGQQAPVAQIALGRPPGSDAMRLVVILMPANTSFPSSVQMLASDKDTQPIELGWRYCVPNGCFADNAAVDDAMKRWRSEAGPAKIMFKDAQGREITIPVSLRGLPQALDGLTKG